MKIEKLQIIFAILALLLGVTMTTYAQGKGQTKKGQTVVKQGQDRDRAKDTDRDRDKDQDQDRDRIRATDLQRDQLRSDLASMDRVRLQIRDMIRDCDNEGFTRGQGHQNHAQIREHIRTMEQEREQFMLGLNEYQRNRFQEDLRNVERFRERVLDRLQLMDQEMNQQEFVRTQHRNRLREIESALKKWEEQYRHMEKHMVDI